METSTSVPSTPLTPQEKQAFASTFNALYGRADKPRQLNWWWVAYHAFVALLLGFFVQAHVWLFEAAAGDEGLAVIAGVITLVEGCGVAGWALTTLALLHGKASGGPWKRP